MAERLLADVDNMNARAKTIKEIMASETSIMKKTSNLFKGLSDGWQGSDEEILLEQSNQLIKYMNDFNQSLEKMSVSIKTAGTSISSKDSTAASYFTKLY